MIKFFRKIRYQLMGENPPAGRAGKTSRYFKYALGEIILVVIGILIALQINNWNEQRKENIRGLNYTYRIEEDLDRLISRSERLLKLNKRILKSVTDTQELLERGTSLNDQEKKTVDFAFLWFPRTTYQMPNMLTYEEMKESGDLQLIEDIELRNALAEFYIYLQQVETVYEKLSQDVENQFSVYNSQIRAHTDPETLDITFTYDFNQLCQDTVFINTFSRMAIHWRGFVYFMDRVNLDAKEVKSKIDAL